MSERATVVNNKLLLYFLIVGLLPIFFLSFFTWHDEVLLLEPEILSHHNTTNLNADDNFPALKAKAMIVEFKVRLICAAMLAVMVVVALGFLFSQRLVKNIEPLAASPDKESDEKEVQSVKQAKSDTIGSNENDRN
ncbi:hypothetical protein ACFLQ1_00450 [Candidatus Auribacterota bacterium]